MEEYVTAEKAAEYIGITAMTWNKLIEAHRIEPATTREEDGAQLYRKSDVQQLKIEAMLPASARRWLSEPLARGPVDRENLETLNRHRDARTTLNYIEKRISRTEE